MQDEQKANEPPMQTHLEPRHAFFIRREGTCDEAFRTLQGRLKSNSNLRKGSFCMYHHKPMTVSLPGSSTVLILLFCIICWSTYRQNNVYTSSLSHDKIMHNKSLNLAYIEQYLASVWYNSNYSIVYLHLLCFFVFNRLNQELFLTTF